MKRLIFILIPFLFLTPLYAEPEADAAKQKIDEGVNALMALINGYGDLETQIDRLENRVEDLQAMLTQQKQENSALAEEVGRLHGIETENAALRAQNDGLLKWAQNVLRFLQTPPVLIQQARELGITVEE